MKTIAILTLAAAALLASRPVAHAAQTDIPGPTGSVAFGTKVTVLPNGNFVVTDPNYSIPSVAMSVGAVYLYDGATLAVISTLTGGTANDQVGSGGVMVLSNGNFVVSSPAWANGGAAQAGAVTWSSGTDGVSGAVSTANSLVGSTANDRVGGNTLTALPNGNYVVYCRAWANGAAGSAGAVTWGSGTAGVSGVVSAANALVGSTDGDMVGGGGVTVLANGNYVVRSHMWDNGAAANAGAVTWGSGSSGVKGVVSAANSLVGSTANDTVGLVTALPNGNYVASSSSWDNGAVVDAGAVTWGSGTAGVSGAVSAANSLVGSTANDGVGGGGFGGVTALPNGNYVVSSPYWDGAVVDAGAVTWGNGASWLIGTVSTANSLVGSTANDQVGYDGVIALTNGNYVVKSPYWANGTEASAGAVTWGSGTAGLIGTVSAVNSLVGSTANDQVGISYEASGVTALANGNYVVSSRYWASATALRVGAVTWGSGTTGVSGAVTAANSLVGSKANDYVGDGGVTALTNGNYVVRSTSWDYFSAVIDAGAVTWGSGTAGVVGAVSTANSLVGSKASDMVGSGVTALTNGNYVVRCPYWDNGLVVDAGAVTWGNGVAGVIGVMSAAKSLVGSTAKDNVGSGGVTALANGNYVVRSPSWANGVVVDAGAATWGSGASGVVGAVSAANSLVGSKTADLISRSGVSALADGNYVVSSTNRASDLVANAGAVTWGDGAAGTVGAVTAINSVLGDVAGGGPTMVFAFDPVNNRLVAGYPAGNHVSLLLTSQTWVPGGTYAWEMSDATGVKGTGWDWLDITGNLTITATNQPPNDPTKQFTIAISGVGAHFDNTKSNSWVIATASDSVIQFNASKFIVTTTGFTPGLNEGTFSVLLRDKSVVLLFTPATPPPPCSDITTSTAALEGAVMVMTFINASGLSSVQALVLDNCAITGRQYSEPAAATNAGTAISGNIELNARTTLLGTTKKVVLWAAKITAGENNAAVNVLALDTCGRGKSFDPVITELRVTLDQPVQQRFTGLLSAERYLQVINGTPGLQWLTVNLNGHVFRLDPLAAGQTVSADLSAAMNEGDANVVVLTGFGEMGASAWVLITDQAVGDLVQLSEVVELALALSGNQVVLSWPEALAGWQLQASETLVGGWTDVPTTPMIANGYQTVSLAQSNQPQFFRLRKASGAAASAPTAASVKATGGTLAPTETLQPTKSTYDRLSW